jgi:predicted RNase H-like nuclease (RuvC/YqgF family)
LGKENEEVKNIGEKLEAKIRNLRDEIAIMEDRSNLEKEKSESEIQTFQEKCKQQEKQIQFLNQKQQELIYLNTRKQNEVQIYIQKTKVMQKNQDQQVQTSTCRTSFH